MRPSRSQPSTHSGRTTGMFMSIAFSHSRPRPSVQTKCVVSIRTLSASLAPILSMAPLRLSRNGAGSTPGVTVMPERSVILCVRTVSFSLLYCPADVRSTRWKTYSASTARPLIFVAVISSGREMIPALLPFRYRLNERRSAVWSSIGSHSKTTEV